jgi:hypothetical protein
MSGMFFGRPDVPCDDCSDGWCTMNCGRKLRKEVVVTAQRGPILLEDATREELISCVSKLFDALEDLRRSMARRR